MKGDMEVCNNSLVVFLTRQMPKFTTECTRVSSIRKDAKGEKWELLGIVGEAAYHDTKELEASKTKEQVIGTADAVLLTDISSSADGLVASGKCRHPRLVASATASKG
jgi:hypothetical protein